MEENHSPIALMVLGTPGTGKTTIVSHIVKILDQKKRKNMLISFDAFRKTLVPPGVNPFTHDENIRKMIYEKAAQEFSRYLREGFTVIIDCGLTRENIRRQLKSVVPQMKICHIHCPLIVAMIRETKRSLLREKHENGHYLYLRALLSLISPFKKEKLAIPPITHTFEYPACADIHVSSFLKNPEKTASEIIEKLKI